MRDPACAAAAHGLRTRGLALSEPGHTPRLRSPDGRLRRLRCTRGSNSVPPDDHTSSRSPDGRYVAFVHQGLNPSAAFSVPRPGGQPARHLRALAPDADWSRRIVWSPDSRTVGFVINEQRLGLFDTATASDIATLTLVKADGYPGSEEGAPSRSPATVSSPSIAIAGRPCCCRPGRV